MSVPADRITGRTGVFDRCAERPGRILAILGVLVAMAWQASTAINTDVSWLLDLGGRVMDGASWYVDFTEVNPPASILLYLPAVALARLIDVRPEPIVLVMVAALCVASVDATSRILARAKVLDRGERDLFEAAVVGVLLLLPMNAFAQREHIALAALLPALACSAARIDGRRPTLAAWILAGVGAGTAIAIKPMFALALLGPALWLIRQQGLRALYAGSAELWLAAGAAGLYYAGVLVLVPAYAERMLPTVFAVYVPARLPWGELLVSPGLLVWLFAVLAWARSVRASKTSTLAAVSVLGSTGFAVAFLMQGKGWPYHAYPAVALAVLGCGLAALARPRSPPDSAIPMAATLGAMMFFASAVDYRTLAPGLVEAMAAQKQHPRLMTISSDIALGHPLVRSIDGAWVGSAAADWVTGTAHRLIERGADPARFASLIRSEQDTAARDMEREHPDFVVVQSRSWLSWIAADPALSSAFSAYRRTGTYGEVMLYSRQPAAVSPFLTPARD